MWLSIVLLVAGLGLQVFGLKVLFQRGFVERLRKGIWKDESGLFSDAEGYVFDRYVTGMFLVVAGLIALIVGVLGVITPYDFS